MYAEYVKCALIKYAAYVQPSLESVRFCDISPYNPCLVVQLVNSAVLDDVTILLRISAMENDIGRATLIYQRSYRFNFRATILKSGRSHVARKLSRLFGKESTREREEAL